MRDRDRLRLWQMKYTLGGSALVAAVNPLNN